MSRGNPVGDEGGGRDRGPLMDGQEEEIFRQ